MVTSMEASYMSFFHDRLWVQMSMMFVHVSTCSSLVWFEL
jgi:hypothetical protein